jgi:PiT family inorganic phosphate transporter
MRNGVPFSTLEAKMAAPPNKAGRIVFMVVVAAGVGYVGYNLISDLSGQETTSMLPFMLLALALVIALGFEFVNGFHDTANAVATVIYTNALNPQVAVVWSGLWNFLGVMLSGGAVAFAIISLLPVELILQVGSGAGFAMVFSLLVAAIIWNLGTWYFGLPSSSSHTLIGSIIGVGLANQFVSASTGTSGVDWAQAGSIGKSLLISPVIGSAFAALLLLLAQRIIPDNRLYSPPEGDQPPPLWIRTLLLLTCTGEALDVRRRDWSLVQSPRCSTRDHDNWLLSHHKPCSPPGDAANREFTCRGT